jgi:hypothetical protein
MLDRYIRWASVLLKEGRDGGSASKMWGSRRQPPRHPSGIFHRNEQDQVSLLSKDGGDLRRDPEVPNAVVITWQISSDQIKKQDAPAADLLSRMCVLDRQGIPRFLFCQDDDSDAIDFEDAIGTLIAFSFVAAEKDGNIFQMHSLVQLSTKKWLEVHGEIEKRKEDLLSLLSEKFPNGEHANWKICEALDPHTRTVLGYHYSPQVFSRGQNTIASKGIPLLLAAKH